MCVRMKKLLKGSVVYTTTLTLLSLGAGVVHADLKYSYLQAAYVFGELEFADADVDIKGYELTAQFELSPSIAVGLNYLSLEGDDTETTATGVNTLESKANGIDAYVLYYSPVGLQTDFLLGVRLDMKDVEARVQGNAPTLQSDDDKKFLFTGLRHHLRGLELNGQWSYQWDTDDGDDRWTYTLGLVSGIPGQLQLGFSVSPDSAGDVMKVFVRQSY